MNGAWLGAWACVASGVVALGWSARPTPMVAIRDAVQERTAATTGRDAALPAPGAIAARDVFRADRRAAIVGYDPRLALTPLPPAAPKPVLVLVGLVTGEDPTAVIEGFPGVEGSRAVRVGDVVGGLVVRRIGASEVRIAGMDTIWILKVRQQWR